MSLPLLTNAQQLFTDTEQGDVDIGFRKTGAFQEQYEMVVYAGNITNFIAQAIGTTVNITNYTYQDLTNMCPDNFNNLQWSVFSSAQSSVNNYWYNYSGAGEIAWPKDTCWYTIARTNVNVQSTPPSRISSASEGTLEGKIVGVSIGANGISQDLYGSQGNTNVYNNSLVVLEPIGLNPAYNLTTYIGQSGETSLGDFGGGVIPYSVENTTPSSFNSAVVSDFYAVAPFNGNHALGSFADPLTGLANGVGDYLGYFTLNPNGTMTFTRAALTPPAPTVSSITASATNGFGPLTVVLSDSTSGSATNWVWNFGNGTIITNTTSGNVTNIYSTAGSYTVTLTVNGPGGSSTETVANYILASPTPKISLTASTGQVVFSGTNCPVGVQYRILTSTNLATALTNWKPVYTNTFANNGSFSYTNPATGGSSYFIMVSP